MSSSLEVGKKLVDLCKQGKFKDAMEQLYASNIVSVEAHAPPGGGAARSEGIAAVRAKGEWWEKNHEVHKCEVSGPWPHGDRFIATFKMDVTPKAGPMAGKRFTMEEGALYTVKDGKVVHEEFFYPGDVARAELVLIICSKPFTTWSVVKGELHVSVWPKRTLSPESPGPTQ